MSDEVTTPAAEKQKQNLSLWASLSLVWEIGYLIAIPAVLFGIGGAYLDKQFSTSPLLTIAGLALALILSIFAVVRAVKRILPHS